MDAMSKVGLERCDNARLALSGGAHADASVLSTDRPDIGSRAEPGVDDTVAVSFERFYQGEYKKAVRTATFILGDRTSAEEVVQDSFVRLHQRWRTLAEPNGYLYTSVVNRCRDRLRRRAVLRRHLRVLASGEDLAALQGPESSDRLDLVDALRRLPTRERTALVLKYYAGLTTDEIAQSMGARPGTVKSLVHRGLRRLRHEMAP